MNVYSPFNNTFVGTETNAISVTLAISNVEIRMNNPRCENVYCSARGFERSLEWTGFVGELLEMVAIE
jgi:hypothetical protein